MSLTLLYNGHTSLVMMLLAEATELTADIPRFLPQDAERRLLRTPWISQMNDASDVLIAAWGLST
jgi:hypothetical protein